MNKYILKIKERKTGKTIKVIGREGITERKMDKVEDGLLKNFDYNNYWFEVVKGRS